MINKLSKKNREIPLQVKASIWFFICSIIQKMVSVVSTAVFIHLISKEDYGLISIYNSWSDILLIFASLNLSSGCFNVGMTKYEESREQWVSSLQILSLIVTTVFGVVFIVSYRFTEKYINLPQELMIVMICTFYFIPAINIWTAKHRYTYSYISLVSITIGYVIFVFALSLIAILVFEKKGLAQIIGSAIASTIFGGVLLVDNIRNSKPIIRKSYMRFAFAYNLQMMPAFLGSVILNQIDRVMIDNMVSREAVAIYTVAYNAAFFISIVSASINATYNPWLMQKAKKGEYINVNEIGNGLSFMLMVIIIAFILCAPEFVRFIAPADYIEAIYIMPAVAGSTYFNLLYTLYCPILQYRLKAKQLSFIMIIASVLNVILNYFAIERWGYIAAGYTTFISYFVMGWGTGLYAMHLLKKEGFSGQLYDLRKLIKVTVALIIAIIVFPFTYDGYLIRYVLLMIIAILFAINAKRITRAFFEIRKG